MGVQNRNGIEIVIQVYMCKIVLSAYLVAYTKADRSKGECHRRPIYYILDE